MRGARTSSTTITMHTLRLLREMSVLDVYLERAAALMTKSFPRGIADSSTKDEELTMPRAKARSASWNTNMRCKVLQQYQNKSANGDLRLALALIVLRLQTWSLALPIQNRQK